MPTTNEAAGRTIGIEEEEAVLRVLRSGMLSGVWGTEVKALESGFAEMMGSAHAVSYSSGTAALHLAVAAVDPAPGDEIIVAPGRSPLPGTRATARPASSWSAIRS